MGEYECLDCNEMFWAEEPPYPIDLCDDCIEERRKEKQRKRKNLKKREHEKNYSKYKMEKSKKKATC